MHVFHIKCHQMLRIPSNNMNFIYISLVCLFVSLLYSSTTKMLLTPFLSGSYQFSAQDSILILSSPNNKLFVPRYMGSNKFILFFENIWPEKWFFFCNRIYSLIFKQVISKSLTFPIVLIYISLPLSVWISIIT